MADFSWKTDAGTETYTFEKFIEMMERREKGNGCERTADELPYL
ncbi:hypothetical protein [Sphingobacterium daejeonense]|nr:hypothetical protein [Sphingobacterium daejeonense]